MSTLVRTMFVNSKWKLFLTSVTSRVEQLKTDSAITSCVLADAGFRLNCCLISWMKTTVITLRHLKQV